ncbi:hypothetical protein AAAW41_001736 [Cronobacter sakazakii]|nr:hypothetical protein [Cronobacter sakazakii]EMC4267753.1 hypothetical protein [Cronobacter sakazakii]EMC4305970.1 hypothetical protein [Cronobacter sakazakii]DAE53881.1 MAG TPA: Protein of unknown function (DUF3443) [Caudoviricetes sp.]
MTIGELQSIVSDYLSAEDSVVIDTSSTGLRIIFKKNGELSSVFSLSDHDVLSPASVRALLDAEYK